MINVLQTPLRAAVVLGALFGSSLAASASTNPTGVWLDHTGRAAIEISNCSGNLCGKIVWLKEAGHKDACGMQIIGNVKPVSGGKWDGGWILDPEKNSKYDVEITPLNDGKLKVMGYAGMKFLSETYTWTRANPDIKRCDVTAERTPDAPTATPNAPPSSNPSAPGPIATPANPPAPPAETPPADKPAPQREADKTPPKGKAKDCKLEFGTVKVTLPCDILDD